MRDTSARDDKCEGRADRERDRRTARRSRGPGSALQRRGGRCNPHPTMRSVSALPVRERSPEVVKAEGERVLLRLPHRRLRRLGDSLVGGQRGRRPAPGCRSCLVIALAHGISRRCDHYAISVPFLAEHVEPRAAVLPSTLWRGLYRSWLSVQYSTETRPDRTRHHSRGRGARRSTRPWLRW